MFNAIRITAGNGASYDNVQIIYGKEVDEHGFPRVFGPYTVMVRYHNVWHAFNEQVLNAIYLRKSKHDFHGIEYSRIVLADDTIYGPGVILDEESMASNDVPKIYNGDGLRQLAISTPAEIIIVSVANVMSISFPHTMQSKKSPQRFGAHTCR